MICPRYRVERSLWPLLAATLILAGAGICRCEPGAAVSNASPADVTVELSSNQLLAIKVGPLATYAFTTRKEASGSVSFEEDPAIVQAESTLLGAAATAVVASNELVRARALYETNGVAQRELEQAVSENQTAAAALAAAREALRALGKTDADIDQTIAAGALAGRSSTKWLLANVMESDSPFVHEGQPITIRLLAFPERQFAGTVSKIYGTVDPNLHHLQVRCAVDDPHDELRPGMLANVTIQVSDPAESTAVPVNAVVREGDGMMTIWVTNDRRHFTQRTVKTGVREDGVVEIVEGLKNDQLVVTDGAIFLDNMVNAAPSD